MLNIPRLNNPLLLGSGTTPFRITGLTLVPVVPNSISPSAESSRMTSPKTIGLLLAVASAVKVKVANVPLPFTPTTAVSRVPAVKVIVGESMETIDVDDVEREARTAMISLER